MKQYTTHEIEKMIPIHIKDLYECEGIIEENKIDIGIYRISVLPNKELTITEYDIFQITDNINDGTWIICDIETTTKKEEFIWDNNKKMYVVNK